MHLMLHFRAHTHTQSRENTINAIALSHTGISMSASSMRLCHVKHALTCTIIIGQDSPRHLLPAAERLCRALYLFAGAEQLHACQPPALQQQPAHCPS